jgi:hypothetical protein
VPPQIAMTVYLFTSISSPLFGVYAGGKLCDYLVTLKSKQSGRIQGQKSLGCIDLDNNLGGFGFRDISTDIVFHHH